MSQTAIDILIPVLCGAAAGSAISAGFQRARIKDMRRRIENLEIQVSSIRPIAYRLRERLYPDQEQ